MEEKGGESKQNSEKSVSKNYVDSKIALTAILVIVFGAIFIIGLVVIGMQVSNKCQNGGTCDNNQAADGPVLESIDVDYERTIVSYSVPEAESEDVTNSFLALNGVKDEEYAIIRSSSELEDYVEAVNSLKTGDAAFTYDVDSSFFKTGSIIVIAKEDDGLHLMDVEKLTRDESYNIHIESAYSTLSYGMGRRGSVAFIKIQNIQPKAVSISWDKEEYNYPEDVVVKKPIIYLYPTETTKVNVRLSNPERLTTDYPNYQKGWTVTAEPDGTLTGQNGKKYYALYYESQNTKRYGADSLDEGFVVSRNEVEAFLEDKLSILGLNYKEREEFITYWAGILEQEPYVFIRFQTATEIDRNMGLIVSPQPDTIIRVMMEYKTLDQKIKAKPQQLSPVTRHGFTVVEWGGTEIK